MQEFQFGMNWPAYSRFVGDVFGAPLAMEGLLAFFMESVFIGLWIFGWVVLTAILRTSYFVLDGFDFGSGSCCRSCLAARPTAGC